MELTLLTHAYPFPPGESFITTELEYLAQHFAAVHIVPTARIPAHAQPTALPVNVYLRDDVQRAIAHRRRAGKLSRTVSLGWDDDGRTAACREMRHADFLFRATPTRLVRRTAAASAAIALAIAVRDALRAAKIPPRVYSYWLHPALLGAAWANCGPLAARAHGADLYRERHKSLYVPLQEQILAAADAVFFISEHGQDAASARHPHLAERFYLSRLGVPPAPCRSRASQDGVLRLLSCASCLPVKRIDRLVDAVQSYAGRLQWTHLGGGPLLPMLQKATRALPAGVQVQWRGQVPPDAVRQFYASEAVDVFVNTSVSEGLPVSVMEAMSYGVPVMAPDVGGMAELVHAENGILLPADLAVVQLTLALQRFAALSSAARARLRDGAYRTWRARVNATVTYPRFVTALRGLTRLRGLPRL